jgi:hypothetical protein
MMSANDTKGTSVANDHPTHPVEAADLNCSTI